MILKVEINFWKSVVSGIFGLSVFLCNKKIENFPSERLYNCCFLNSLDVGGVRTCSGWGIQVWKWSGKKVAFLGNIGFLRHWCKENKSANFWSKISLYPDFFGADPDWGDKACSCSEIWVRISRKNKSKMFSLEASDYQDTDAIEENHDFLVEYSSTSVVFSMEILMEEIELVVAQNWMFEHRANQNK